MRNLVSAIVCVFSTLVIVSCEKEKDVPVSSVSISQGTAEMLIGETIQLNATVLPSDASDKTVTWASSKQSVATVTNKGSVTAIAEGTSTITASAGGKSGTCTITVSKKVVEVSSIELNKTSAQLKVGETVTITATVKPDDATNKTVTWTTSDVSVATVDNGAVAARKVGSVTITAKAGNKSATCTITVTDQSSTPDNQEGLNISISDLTATSVKLSVTTTSTKTYFWLFHEKAEWDQYGGDAIWDAYISYFKEEGELAYWIVTGNDAITATDMLDANTEYIVFAAFCDKQGVRTSDFYTKTFTTPNGNGGDNPGSGDNPGDNNDPTLSSLEIDTGLSLVVGESKTLTVKGHDENYHSVESPKVKWKSNKPSVATVDQDGNVRAVSAGIAIITATATKGDASDNCKVLVVSDASYYNKQLDLGLSVKWAQQNIGANRPEGFGRYYTWGAQEPWSSVKNTCPYSYSTSAWSSKKDEVVDSDYNLYRTLDPAHILLGKNWRLPTKKEFDELLDNCSFELVRINGKIGSLFISKKNGYGDRWLFFPHTGICWAGYPADASDDEYSHYWSSTINHTGIYNFFAYEAAWELQISRLYNDEPFVNCESKTSGCPIRPVYSEKSYFEIIVSDITSSQCVVTTGTNSSDTYFSTVINKSYLAQYDVTTLCQALIDYSKENGTLGDFLSQGDVSLRYNNLSANSDQVVIAIFCDKNGTTKGSAYSKVFTTK